MQTQLCLPIASLLLQSPIFWLPIVQSLYISSAIKNNIFSLPFCIVTSFCQQQSLISTIFNRLPYFLQSLLSPLPLSWLLLPPLPLRPGCCWQGCLIVMAAVETAATVSGLLFPPLPYVVAAVATAVTMLRLLLPPLSPCCGCCCHRCHSVLAAAATATTVSCLLLPPLVTVAVAAAAAATATTVSQLLLPQLPLCLSCCCHCVTAASATAASVSQLLLPVIAAAATAATATAATVSQLLLPLCPSFCCHRCHCVTSCCCHRYNCVLASAATAATRSFPPCLAEGSERRSKGSARDFNHLCLISLKALLLRRSPATPTAGCTNGCTRRTSSTGRNEQVVLQQESCEHQNLDDQQESGGQRESLKLHPHMEQITKHREV